MAFWKKLCLALFGMGILLVCLLAFLLSKSDLEGNQMEVRFVGYDYFFAELAITNHSDHKVAVYFVDDGPELGHTHYSYRTLTNSLPAGQGMIGRIMPQCVDGNWKAWLQMQESGGPHDRFLSFLSELGLGFSPPEMQICNHTTRVHRCLPNPLE